MTKSEWEFYKPFIWALCVLLSLIGIAGACTLSSVAAERRIPVKNERLLERQIERDKQRLQSKPKQAHVTYYMRVDELKAGRPLTAVRKIGVMP